MISQLDGLKILFFKEVYIVFKIQNAECEMTSEMLLFGKHNICVCVCVIKGLKILLSRKENGFLSKNNLHMRPKVIFL